MGILKRKRVTVSPLTSSHPLTSLPQSNPLSYDNQPTLVSSLRLNKMRRFQDKVESRGILYILVSQFLSEAKPKLSASDDRIRSILNYIRKNIGTKITLEELAEMSCLSKNHLIRVFKKEIGTTPNQYVTRMKVERAMVMLATGDTPIKNIALMLGYDDNSYFIRTFKKETGQTPQQYRDNR